MELSTLLRLSDEQLQQAIEQNPVLNVTVTESARVLVRRVADGGFEVGLRVKGETVVFVPEDELDRFRQRLKEQIAIHVPRDQHPDLTGS